MKRACLVVFLLSLVSLVAYFRLISPRIDQASLQAESNQPSPSVIAPIHEVADEIPLVESAASPAEAEPSVSDSPAAIAREAIPDNEMDTSGGVQLEDRMLFVDGIELQYSREVFEWLLTEEGRNESWAIPMEAELQAYFRSLPYLRNNFTVPYIHCRETMCGIQVIGYGQEAAKNWIEAIANMERRSWEGAKNLDTVITMEELQSDAVGFVLYTTDIAEEEAP